MAKIKGVSDIKTDISGRNCTFKVSDPDVDYKGKLKEFAETNTHLAGYTIQ
ncbi:hypothetical protein [Planctomycetes bacterium K23_9]|uniref:hypothetical protein n=1 Tax=Stieleria marina TaxID=1930275 RepID=UPI0011A34DDD